MRRGGEKNPGILIAISFGDDLSLATRVLHSHVTFFRVSLISAWLVGFPGTAFKA
jgi:hypothetical protein